MCMMSLQCVCVLLQKFHLRLCIYSFVFVGICIFLFPNKTENRLGTQRSCTVHAHSVGIFMYSGDLNNKHLNKELSLVHYSDAR